METEILALAIVISGLCIGLLWCAVIAWLVTAAIWHLFSNCAYSRWVKAEILQEEDLTQYGNAQVGDCLKPKG
jgi:hypothetical protein